MAKLPHTALTSIAISFLVMNLSTLLLRLLWAVLCLFFSITPFFDDLINTVDDLILTIHYNTFICYKNFAIYIIFLENLKNYST